MAQQPDNLVASLQKTVDSCLISPPGATGRVVVSATFGPDGLLKDKPKIVRKGEGPLEDTKANTGGRAIPKCAPQLVGFGRQGEVIFNFDPSGLLPAPRDSASVVDLNSEQLTSEVNGKRIISAATSRQPSDN